MQQVLCDKSPLMGDKLLTQLFIQRLPPSIRVVLANSVDGIKLDALSELADKMVEATLVEAVHNQPPLPAPYSALPLKVMELRQDMAEIKGTLAELRLELRGYDYSRRGRSRSRSSPSHARTGSNLANGTMCCYHTNFGTSAERCNQPCSFQGNSQGPVLEAANGSTIATYGDVSLSLDLGLRRTFPWIFTVSDAQQPILGAEFLREYRLIVDLLSGQLHDATTDLKSRV